DDVHAQRIAIECQRAVHVGYPDDEMTERGVGQNGHHVLDAGRGAARPATPSPRSPKVQAGSRFSWPISQLTAAVITGSPSVSACQRNRRAATVPARIGNGS